MKILIMGGTEFVSSSLAKYMIAQGHSVDIFTRGINKLNYEGVSKHHIGNRLRIKDLMDTIKDIEFDYVFDISAYHVLDVKNLLQVLNRKKMKRYIFCSSGAVYKPSKETIDEKFETGINAEWGDYGLNKLEAENYLLKLHKDENLPVVIFRPTYIYGPNNNLYREGYLFDRLTNGKDIPIPSGDTKVQFIYISDLIKVFESAMYKEKSIGQVYNVTNPQEVTWEELVITAMRVTKRKVNIKYIDSSADYNTREYFPFRNCTYLLDISKLQRYHLYTPKINLLKGMTLSYKWYCNKKPKLYDKKMNRVDEVLEM